MRGGATVMGTRSLRMGTPNDAMTFCTPFSGRRRRVFSPVMVTGFRAMAAISGMQRRARRPLSATLRVGGVLGAGVATAAEA